MLQNSLYAPAQIEAEREGIYRESVNTQDQTRVVIEAAHFTNYRDHYIGQPALGVRDNVPNITEEHVRAFHRTHFVGPHVVVSAAGNVNHNSLVSAVEKGFSGLSSQAPAELHNSEKPYATPSIINMRDDELTNLNVGVFFNAPTWTDPDFLAVHFFSKILGNYRVDKYTGFHLNAPDRQYNQLHAALGTLPDVSYQKCFYFPYSDTAMFGNYLLGNEVFSVQMSFLTQMVLSEYAANV